MISPASPDTLSAMASNSGRLKRGFMQLRNASGTWLLVRILVIIQAVPTIWNLLNLPGHPDKLQQLQHLLGLNQNQLFSGNFWQPISYALVHGNWLHLALNAAAILLLGSKLEHIISKRSFWLLCLYSVIAGAALFLAFGIFSSANTSGLINQTLVGSSSICFGFLVFQTTISPQSRFLPLFLSGKTIGLAIILATLVLALIDPTLPFSPIANSQQPLSFPAIQNLFKISHACHLGGAITGWIYARYILRPRTTLKSLKRAREKAEKMALNAAKKRSASTEKGIS